MIDNLKKYGPWAIALLMVVAAALGWYRPAPKPQKEYVQVEKQKIVEKIQRVEVPVERVVVVEKVKVVEKLGLPDWIKQDQDTQVLAAGIVPAYRGETSIVSLIDTKTGEGSIIQQRRTLPFFEFLNEKEVGAIYGTGIAAWATWTFVRVGSFYATAGAVGTYSGGSQMGVAGIGVSYRW